MANVLVDRQLDMGRFVGYLQDRRAEVENPKHAAMLGVLIEHCIAEVKDLNIERTMATLIADPVYHYWGDRSVMRAGGVDPPRSAHRAEVQAAYEAGMREGWLSMHTLELEVERFFINDDAIAWDGMQYARVPGGALAANGEPFPDGGTVEDEYIKASRSAVFISFRDGRMVGEDFYLDGEISTTRVASHDQVGA
jgi:hypothetical protein